MTDPIEQLGPRLKEYRNKAGISLREVARKLEVSPSFVSQIENGKSQPSVATLYSFARLFGVPVDHLFVESLDSHIEGSRVPNTAGEVSRDLFHTPTEAWDSSKALISAVNPTNRSKIIMESGVHWERLAATSDSSVNFMEIYYPPGSQSKSDGTLLTHDGFEYGYALEGEIEITVGDVTLTIAKGHSIGFDCSIPHRFRNTGSSNFRGIWFVHSCQQNEVEK